MSIEPMHPVAEIATAWGVSKNHVYALIKTGALRSVNLGHGRAKIRVPESALNAYVEQLTEDQRPARAHATRGHLKVVAA